MAADFRETKVTARAVSTAPELVDLLRTNFRNRGLTRPIGTLQPAD